VNGRLVCYSSCGRGVKQGGPFSPIPLCLEEEVLNRCLTQLVQEKMVLPMAGRKGFQLPSHVLSTYEIFVFLEEMLDF